MPFLPRMKFQIVSHRTPEEVRALLQSATDSGRTWSAARPKSKLFVGKVGETDFKVMTVPDGFVKNSFKPVIVGRIRTEGNQTVVDVRMRLIWFVFGFMAVWFSVPVFSFLVLLLALITGNSDGWMAVPVAALILFGQLLVRCGFYYPAKKARRKLEELLGKE